MSREPVSVIVTVRNEEGTIDALLDSLLAGNRRPEEIVVADGGSTDGTAARLRARAAADPHVRMVAAPGNRSVGRNAAVRAARHAVLACTDAGATVEPGWLERIVAPLEADPGIGAVAGFYRPDGRSPFERAAGVISAPARHEVNPRRFLPSTRSVAFRREAWQRAGGFDEALSHNEDTPFALALKAAGTRVAFAPDAIVRWRPRGDLKSFWRQHRRFGFGDGESRVQAWFYRTLAAKYALAAGLLLLGFVRPLFWWALVGGAAAFWWQQARRGIGRIPTLEALVAVPPLKILYDAAYLTGYARGRLSPPAKSSRPAPPTQGAAAPPLSPPRPPE
jgi:cellulose synthase/poly-beta-1,6-N-acetylglucosamine synthase-like glycosyltransferase